MIEILDQWTDAGSVGEANEDGWGTACFENVHTFWLIDGCTDLDRENSRQFYPLGISSAHWHKDALSQQLRTLPYINADHDPKTYIASVVQGVKTSYENLGLGFDKELWQYPSSTLIWCAYIPTENLLRILWLGDSSALVRHKAGALLAFPPPRHAPDVISVQKGETTLFQDQIEAYREKRASHIKTGMLSLSLFPENLTGLAYLDLQADKYPEILLMSDGFARILSVFDAINASSLFPRKITSKNALSSYGSILRRLEQAAAKTLSTREAKLHDDATAIRVRLEPRKNSRLVI